MPDLLIAIRAFNRADYLKQELESLEANTDLDCDFLLFQDGLINKHSDCKYATQEEIDKSIQVCEESKLPNKTIIISKDNIGGANVKMKTLKYAFPKYDYLMMLDNDLVFTKDYIHTIKVLFKQFEKDPGIAMIQTSYRHFSDTPIETKEYIEANKDKVAYGFSHRWEQGIFRGAWEVIKDRMKDFIKINQRNDTMWLVKADPRAEADYALLCSIYGKATDDWVLETCIKKCGFKGLHTKVLRHKSIGKNGHYTMNEGRWFSENFDSIVLSEVGDIERYSLVTPLSGK